jgi:hypothetical protein
MPMAIPTPRRKKTEQKRRADAWKAARLTLGVRLVDEVPHSNPTTVEAT